MSNFDGDPKIILTSDGSDIQFIGGQPIMDQGLENDAIISLFTLPGWVGNIFLKNNRKIGSRFVEKGKGSITIQTLNDLRQIAESSLNSSAYGKKTAVITNPNAYQLNAKIIIEPPGQDANELILEKNGQNWINQKNNPAYRKI